MTALRKILLVDDDDDLREALSEQLVMTEDFDVAFTTLSSLMSVCPTPMGVNFAAGCGKPG